MISFKFAHLSFLKYLNQEVVEEEVFMDFVISVYLKDNAPT